MLADLWRDDLAAIGREAEMGALLVRAHQARIADDVGSKDRRQPPLQSQLISPQSPEQLGGLGRQPLDEDGPTPRQHPGDPGIA